MEVKIGITDVPREVTIRAKDSAEEILSAWKSAQDSDGLFEIQDEKGRRVVVPASRIGYLDMGASDVRPVGFGAV